MIVAASDLHGQLTEHLISLVNKADLFLLAGDLAACNETRKLAFKYYGAMPPKDELRLAEKSDVQDAMAMLARLEKLGVPVCIVKGNAEMYSTESLPKYEDFVKDFHVIDIDGKVHKHGGLKIGGLGYFHEAEKLRMTNSATPERLKKAEKEEKEAKEKLERLKKIDILLSHDPPQGFLDLITDPNAPRQAIGKHLGSFMIRKFVETEQPKFHVCGHIHEGRGEARLGKTTVLNVGNGKGEVAVINGKSFRFE